MLEAVVELVTDTLVQRDIRVHRDILVMQVAVDLLEVVDY